MYNDLGVQSTSGGETYRPEGYYYETLTAEQLEMVLPEKQNNWTVESAKAGFLVTGEIDSVTLKLTTEAGSVSVLLGNPLPGGDVIYRDAELKRSQCGDVTYTIIYRTYNIGQGSWVMLGANTTINSVPLYFTMAVDPSEEEFAVYEYPVTKDYVALEAVTQIDGYWFYFNIGVWQEDVEQFKPDFKDMLESFTAYAHREKLGWEDITAEGVIPEQDRQLTWEEAVLDPDFGSYARLTAPEGAQTGATRYIGFRADYLELYWKQEESELTWKVSYYDEKQYAARMTSVFDIYSYGNGTGLLFEAEDITKELVTRSLLTSRKRISFGIRYEGFLIRIRGESVDRTWLWEQLAANGIIEDDEQGGYTYTEVDMLAMYEDEPLGRYAPRMESFIGWSVWKYESEQKSYLELTRSWFPEDPQYLKIQITAFADESKLVRPDEREKYDLLAHSTGPWDSDIPEQFSGIMPRPVFEASEITPDMVRSRVYYTQADHTAPRMEFGVRYGDVVVYVFSIGLSPNEIYNYIRSISPEEP